MDSEPARRVLEVSSIMRHNRVYLPIDGRVEHHFIVCVRQLWPPDEVNLDWLNDFCKLT